MIRIVTDTTSSMTKEQYQSLGITAVPLYVNEGDTMSKELFEISYADFYQRQRAGSKFTTSQPDPNSFMEVFRPIIDAGDEVICITISSGISGTINSAHLAKEMLESDKISIVDSRESGHGQASLAIKAAELAKSGLSREEIVQKIDDMRDRTRIYFIVESLRYLYEGGRLNGVQALIGSVIQLKPIVWFDAKGIMTSFEKIRTLRAAKERVLELIRERAKLGVEEAGLHYGDNYEEAVAYAKEIEAIVGMPVHLVQVSPVIGTHTGPDLLGPMIVTKQA